MKIEDKKVVELIYELQVEGQIVDKTTEDKPLSFIQGMGCLLPLFEKNIEGKEPGDAFAFTLEPKDGYGEWHLENIIELPKQAFEVDGQVREDLLVPGTVIPLMNSMGGVIPGKVLEVLPDKVKMDMNHPMAGKTLDFSGKIVSVREATQKELTEGLHGEFAQGGGCHGCHGGEGCEGGCEGGCHGEDHAEGECCHGEGKGEGCHKDGEGCCHKK